MFDQLFETLKAKKDRWANEEEVRLGWISALQNALGIDFHAERGKKDSSYNNVVIEFKDRGKFNGKITSPAFKEAMYDRLRPYIVKTAREEGREGSDYIGIAIDGEHISFAQVADESITHGPLLPFSKSSVAMVAMACKDAFRRAITADNVIADFGHTSDGGRQLVQTLADTLGRHMNESGNNKVKMLFEEWQSLFGQVADLSTEQSAAVRREIRFEVEAQARLRIPLALFVIHTYNSLIIKLLAAEIISAHGLTSHKHFAQTLATSGDDAVLDAVSTEIERGAFYASAGIEGFVQEVLFSWYLDACKDAGTKKAIVTALRAVLVQLSLYRTDRLDSARSSDLLKRFYQDLVPDVLRKSLGEFYTPDWLVNFTLDKAEVKDWLKVRLPDPTCGSGSFLLAALQRKRAAAKAAGLADAQTVEMLTATV